MKYPQWLPRMWGYKMVFWLKNNGFLQGEELEAWNEGFDEGFEAGYHEAKMKGDEDG